MNSGDHHEDGHHKGRDNHPRRKAGKAAASSSAGPLTARVITVSTRAARGEYPDRTGPVLVAALRDLGFETTDPVVVPDLSVTGEPTLAAELTRALIDDCAVILTTGGTGLSPDDLTPEITGRLGGRSIPGIPEAMRAAGVTAGVPTAVLSRGIAVAVGQSMIVNLAGSPGAVEDALGVLRDVLPHAVAELRRPRPPRIVAV